MKNFILIFIICCLGIYPATAQECPAYYPNQLDSEYEISSYNKKDKLTGYIRQKVIEAGSNEWTIESTNYSPKDEELNKVTFRIKCDGGNLKVDMISMLSADALLPYEGMEMKVESDFLDFPGSLMVGQDLPEGTVKVEVFAGSDIKLATISSHVYNRKVEAIETITTSLGTFECYKITYDVDGKVGFIKFNGKSAEWLNLDAGVIRSDSYNDKGKLTGYSLRTK